MIPHKDNYLICDENNHCSIAICSVIGQRNEQQDCAGFAILPDSCIIVVCDGMGGLSGGKNASNHVVNRMVNVFEECAPIPRPKSFLCNAAAVLDAEVNSLLDESGSKIRAGTTCTTVLIQNKLIYWLSAGDSRIYWLRNGNMRQLTCDHTYGVYLKEALAEGRISNEFYQQEIIKGAGLISFIGIGNLNLFDCDSAEIMSGDRFLLITDGLYKYITNDEICSIISDYSNIEDAFCALDSKANCFAENNQIERDNSTIAIITIK